MAPRCCSSGAQDEPSDGVKMLQYLTERPLWNKILDRAEGCSEAYRVGGSVSALLRLLLPSNAGAGLTLAEVQVRGGKAVYGALFTDINQLRAEADRVGGDEFGEVWARLSREFQGEPVPAPGPGDERRRTSATDMLNGLFFGDGTDSHLGWAIWRNLLEGGVSADEQCSNSIGPPAVHMPARHWSMDVASARYQKPSTPDCYICGFPLQLRPERLAANAARQYVTELERPNAANALRELGRRRVDLGHPTPTAGEFAAAVAAGRDALADFVHRCDEFAAGAETAGDRDQGIRTLTNALPTSVSQRINSCAKPQCEHKAPVWSINAFGGSMCGRDCRTVTPGGGAAPPPLDLIKLEYDWAHAECNRIKNSDLWIMLSADPAPAAAVEVYDAGIDLTLREIKAAMTSTQVGSRETCANQNNFFERVRKVGGAYVAGPVAPAPINMRVGVRRHEIRNAIAPLRGLINDMAKQIGEAASAEYTKITNDRAEPELGREVWRQTCLISTIAAMTGTKSAINALARGAPRMPGAGAGGRAAARTAKRKAARAAAAAELAKAVPLLKAALADVTNLFCDYSLAATDLVASYGALREMCLKARPPGECGAPRGQHQRAAQLLPTFPSPADAARLLGHESNTQDLTCLKENFCAAAIKCRALAQQAPLLLAKISGADARATLLSDPAGAAAPAGAAGARAEGVVRAPSAAQEFLGQTVGPLAAVADQWKARHKRKSTEGAQPAAKRMRTRSRRGGGHGDTFTRAQSAILANLIYADIFAPAMQRIGAVLQMESLAASAAGVLNQLVRQVHALRESPAGAGGLPAIEGRLETHFDSMSVFQAAGLDQYRALAQQAAGYVDGLVAQEATRLAAQEQAGRSGSVAPNMEPGGGQLARRAGSPPLLRAAMSPAISQATAAAVAAGEGGHSGFGRGGGRRARKRRRRTRRTGARGRRTRKRAPRKRAPRKRHRTRRPRLRRKRKHRRTRRRKRL